MARKEASIKEGAEAYDASKIQVLEGLEAVRKRPEVTTINTTFLPNVPQMFIDVDRDKVLKQGVEISQAEWDEMKKDISDLRKEKKAATPAVKDGMVDKALEAKGYGPDAGVKTKDGKLTLVSKGVELQ